jgi:hypothetical protein
MVGMSCNALFNVSHLLGFCATTMAGGASAAKTVDWSPLNVAAKHFDAVAIDELPATAHRF